MYLTALQLGSKVSASTGSRRLHVAQFLTASRET